MELGKLTYAGYDQGSKDERYVKAAALLRRAVMLDPALPDIHYFLAITLSGMEQRKEAMNSFQMAIQLDPHNLRTLTVYADSLAEWGCNDEAESIFQKVLKKAPRYTLALRYYATMLLYRSEDYVEQDISQAIELLRKALAVNPEDASTHYYLGLAYSWLDDHQEEAILHIREVLKLEPESKRATKLLSKLTEESAEI